LLFGENVLSLHTGFQSVGGDRSWKGICMMWETCPMGLPTGSRSLLYQPLYHYHLTPWTAQECTCLCTGCPHEKDRRTCLFPSDTMRNCTLFSTVL
jgi:hypothetical protein